MILIDVNIVSIIFIYLWFAFLLFQSFGKVKLGIINIPSGWLLLNIAIYSLFVYFAYFKILELQKLIIPCAIYVFLFSLVYIFDLYSHGIIYNRLEHLIGSFLITYISYIVIQSIPNLNILEKPLQIILAVLVAIFLSVVGELLELGLDFFLKEKNIGPGPWDTNLDLLMDLFGSLGFMLLILIA